MKILMAWTGTQDLDAPTHPEEQTGPICSAVEERRFDRLVLIANQGGGRVAAYTDWLSRRTPAEIVVERVQLSDPTDLNAIHEIDVGVVESCRQAVAPDIPELTFHLSPGTWAMALVWAILGATRFPAKFLQSMTFAWFKAPNAIETLARMEHAIWKLLEPAKGDTF